MRAAFPDSNFLEAQLDPDTAVLAKGYDVVCTFVNDSCNAETIRILGKSGVKLLALRCAGYDSVDLEAAAEAGIKVVRVPRYSPESVAEYAVALLLALNRHMCHTFNRVRDGNYTLSGLIGFEIHGKTAGVVGTGGIGKALARILLGFGCKVLAHDIYPDKELQSLGVTYLPLEEMLPQCDIISLHCPLNKATHHMMNKERIALLKRGVTIINTSRGGLVETDAMVDALESGHVGHLGMDCYEGEGQLFYHDWTSMSTPTRLKAWDSHFQRLRNLPNVIITPHTAFLTEEALHNIAATTINNIREWADGKPLTNQVLH
ncbi:hypothetical protein WJX72_000901 [[Myrmecia] bisecta]|uniref:D-lactate dehydrogenase n=1 Tax=[Myrmecia] bisecta TaxID=41462 RepID=A0AAW1QA41_9CHLO